MRGQFTTLSYSRPNYPNFISMKFYCFIVTVQLMTVSLNLLPFIFCVNNDDWSLFPDFICLSFPSNFSLPSLSVIQIFSKISTAIVYLVFDFYTQLPVQHKKAFDALLKFISYLKFLFLLLYKISRSIRCTASGVYNALCGLPILRCTDSIAFLVHIF